MARIKNRQQHWIAIVLSLAMVVWSIAPTIGHSPFLSDASGSHSEWIADHGHSHGSAEDIWWALHGHSHEQADHDHNSFYLFRHVATEPGLFPRTRWQLPAIRLASDFPKPPERPPRS